MTDLLSCSIIERDQNGDVLWAWTYPSVKETHRTLLLRKCTFDTTHHFLFGQFKNEWFYINSCEVFDSDNLHGVKQFALVVWSNDFNPEKYETLCRILSKTYCKTGNPASLLELFLSVTIHGACTTEENGTFVANTFDHQQATNNHPTLVKGHFVLAILPPQIHLPVPPSVYQMGLKKLPGFVLIIDVLLQNVGLIQLFGLETILIYTVLLLKKRLVVYHHSLPILLKWMRTFPALVSHRDESAIFFPWVDSAAEELVQLTALSSYIVGCRDNSVAQPDHFDVLVNLPAREITIAPHAKEKLLMTKAHKEIALFMVQLAENEALSEQQVVQAVTDKTKELLAQLMSLATICIEDGKQLLSVETLRQKKLTPAVENFLFQLALAENMLML